MSCSENTFSSGEARLLAPPPLPPRPFQQPTMWIRSHIIGRIELNTWLGGEFCCDVEREGLEDLGRLDRIHVIFQDFKGDGSGLVYWFEYMPGTTMTLSNACVTRHTIDFYWCLSVSFYYSNALELRALELAHSWRSYVRLA